MHAGRALTSLWRASGSRGARFLGGAGALLSLSSACRSSGESELPRDDRTTVSALSATPARAGPPVRLRPDVERECKPLASRCDVRDESCQGHLFELTRCVSGRDGTRPPLRFVSREASRRERRERRAHASRERAELERALHALGLGVAPDAADEGEPSALDASASYTPSVRAVSFVHDESTAFADELAVLSVVHEYVHALQDRGGELLAIQNGSGTRSFDQELALWSSVEGEATLHEELVRGFFHDRDPGTWLVARLAARTDGSDGATARQRRPLEASFATFPYTYGAYWAALAAGPPSSTQQIMGKRHEWPPADATPCDDTTPPSLAPDNPRRGRDTLGAWLVQTYVRRRTRDAELARHAARRWRGDWLTFYSRAPSFVWQTCWDSRETALELRELIAAQLSASAGDRASVTSDGQRVTAIVNADERQRAESVSSP